MTRSLAEIEPLFSGGEPEERRLALKELVAIRGAGVVPLFVRALGDDDWRVRKEAASLTPRVEPKEELFAALSNALDDRENIGLRNAAVEAFVSLGPDAVDPALKALDSLDADARKLAVEILGGVPDERGVSRLVLALHDADPNVMLAAAEALGRAGLASESARSEATSALLGCLETTNVALTLASLEALVRLDARLPYVRVGPLARNPLLRRMAITAAAHTREEPAVAVLVEAASAASSVGREAALALAAWLGEVAAGSRIAEKAGQRLREDPAAVAALRAAAEEAADPELRGAALVLLGAARDAKDLAILVSALDDEEVSASAFRGLELFGPTVSSGLGSLLEFASQEGRATLLGLLTSLPVKLEPRTLRAARECLADTSTEVIAGAASVLGAFGDERDLGRLVSLTAHGDSRVADAATNAVEILAGRQQAAARALLGALDPTAEHAAAGAAIVSALARSGAAAADQDLVTFGERALRSVDARARRLSVAALVASGDPNAKDKIAVALSDEEREVRLAAVRALGNLGASEQLRAIVLGSSDEETVTGALRALADASISAAEELARTLVRSPEPALASAAVEVLARAEGEARTEGLLLALNHADKDVVMLALSELGGGLSPPALSRAAVCLTHPAWEVRRLASEIFGEDRSEAARELLRARLELELEPEVREALTEALSIRPPRDGGGTRDPQGGA
jgi:HEAT repeat protein